MLAWMAYDVLRFSIEIGFRCELEFIIALFFFPSDWKLVFCITVDIIWGIFLLLWDWIKTFFWDSYLVKALLYREILSYLDETFLSVVNLSISFLVEVKFSGSPPFLPEPNELIWKIDLLLECLSLFYSPISFLSAYFGDYLLGKFTSLYWLLYSFYLKFTIFYWNLSLLYRFLWNCSTSFYFYLEECLFFLKLNFIVLWLFELLRLLWLVEYSEE